MKNESHITIGMDDNDQPVRLDTAKIFGSRLLIQGDSGSGKSVMVRRIAEQTAGLLPWFIIDPEGEYATLRQQADVLVLGGDHGDAPLHVSTAKAYAHELRSAGINVVLDLSEMDGTTEQRQWVRAFLDGLIEVKSGPKALVLVDECHEFAPENGKGESCATESVARLMKRGRKRGLAGVVVTQRLSSLSKEVGSLCTNVLIGTTAPLDAARAAELMGLPARDKHKFTRLPTHCWMGRGQAISVEPVEFKTAFPVTREPDPAMDDAKPATSASLAKLAKALGKIKPPSEEKTKGDRATAPVVDGQAIEDAVAARDEYWRTHYARLLYHLSGHMKALRLARNAMGACFDDAKVVLGWTDGEAKEKIAAEVSPPPDRDLVDNEVIYGMEQVKQAREQRPKPEPPTADPPIEIEINGTQQRILDALAWWESMGVTDPGNARIGVIAGVDHTGGYWSNTLGPLSVSGLVKRSRGSTTLTPEGRSLAQRPDTPTTLKAYHNKLRDRFSGRTLDVLNCIINVGNRELTTEQIGELVRIDHTGGYFSNTIGPISSFGLIKRGRGTVKPTRLLFPEALK